MKVSRNVLLIGVLTVGATGIGVVGASAALNRGDASTGAAHEHAAHSHAASNDRFAMARERGVDPASAKQVLQDSFGRSYSIARSGDTSCLMHTDGVDSCNTTDEIAAGQGLQVQADCSTNGAGSRMMLVRGLVPQEVADLRVGYSDGSLKRAKVAEGAVLLEAPTPGAGDAYPTSVTWSGSDGRALRDAPFPFDGQKLCLPVPDRP